MASTRTKAQPSKEQQLRLDWAASLRDELEAKGLTPKVFHALLTDAGAEVTQQAVYQWLSGASSPSPHNQAYCALVLRAPAHRLFPIPKVTGPDAGEAA